ncbi:MAG: hypothetical protein KTR30_36060 [Saprospiraceae bacterium]|nr:hypothetical protein [Saprospiraceae bacterium]
MKTTLTTSMLALFLLVCMAYLQEPRDTFAIGRHLAVYSIPIVVIIFLNNFFLILIPNKEQKGLKPVLISLIPCLFLIGIGSLFRLRNTFLEGSLSSLFLLTGVVTAINNLYWIYLRRRQETEKSSAS